jgi:SAM-dependent methyltransferase
MATVSQFDIDISPLIRNHIDQFIIGTQLKLNEFSGNLLELGPQTRSLACEKFTNFKYHSFDIFDTYSPDFVGDITKHNAAIPDHFFDCILCMDVLEHVLNPFDAISELRRILKDGGYLLLSSPLNLRIHGPIPDCWRFTEHGYKSLLRDFDIVEIDILETPGRDLFPLHYNVLAKNNLAKKVNDSDLNFRFIT